MRLQLQTGIIFLAVASATITEAQVAPVQQQFPQRQQPHGNPAALKPPADVSQQAAVTAQAVPQSALSLLDQPANPAQIQVDTGKLSVKADNSTLSGILHDISAKTGMTVDGLSRDQRIFGNYGPASPREVLSALLDGLGYNVLMVGALDNGAPRQLVLTPRTGASAAASGNRQMPVTRQNNNGDDDDDSTPDQPDNTPQPPRPEPNPPEANQQPEQTPPANQPGQVRTPQQMLQELQQMRQLQQQQQQANPQ